MQELPKRKTAPKVISIRHWCHSKRSVIYHYNNDTECIGIITDMTLALGNPIKAHVVYAHGTLTYGGSASGGLIEEGKRMGQFEFVNPPEEILEHREALKKAKEEEEKEAVNEMTKEVLDAAREAKLGNSDTTRNTAADTGWETPEDADPVPPESARNSRQTAVKDSRLRK